jgi:hypothetical protein
MDSCLKIAERGLFCPWCCFYGHNHQIGFLQGAATFHQLNTISTATLSSTVFIGYLSSVEEMRRFIDPEWVFSYIAGSWSATFLHRRTNAQRKRYLTNWLLILCHVDEIMGRLVTNYKFGFLCSDWTNRMLKGWVDKMALDKMPSWHNGAAPFLQQAWIIGTSPTWKWPDN